VERCYACQARLPARGPDPLAVGPPRAPAEAPGQALFKRAGIGLLVAGGALVVLASVLHAPAWLVAAGVLVGALSSLAFRLARAAGYEVEDPDTDIDPLRGRNDYSSGDPGQGWP
jgi:hypothetical protein